MLSLKKSHSDRVVRKVRHIFDRRVALKKWLLLGHPEDQLIVHLIKPYTTSMVLPNTACPAGEI